LGCQENAQFAADHPKTSLLTTAQGRFKIITPPLSLVHSPFLPPNSTSLQAFTTPRVWGENEAREDGRLAQESIDIPQSSLDMATKPLVTSSLSVEEEEQQQQPTDVLTTTTTSTSNEGQGTAAASTTTTTTTSSHVDDLTSTIDSMYLCPDKLQDPAVVEALPQLKVEASLSSNKPREPTDVTLITQLSFERLYMLQGQCDVWHGVISAAVHIALVNGKAVTVELNSNQDPQLTDMSEILQRFKEFHTFAENRGLCKLDLLLIAQDVESVWLSGLYPVNAMRNRALANARTDIVLLLDVDFWPSAELSEVVQRPGKYASLLAAVESKNAIVLPAYETGDQGDIGVEVAREVVIEGKDTAVTMFWDGRIKPFHGDNYKQGHRATDYKRWLEADKPYRIRYEEGYEPYVLVSRKFVPWYDERFVGYRKNKVVHLLHLAQTGMQFVVHPRAFTVHSPHPRARTWKVTHKTGLWDQLAELYNLVKTGLESNTYIPASMYSCGDHVVGPEMTSQDGVVQGTWARKI